MELRIFELQCNESEVHIRKLTLLNVLGEELQRVREKERKKRVDIKRERPREKFLNKLEYRYHL